LRSTSHPFEQPSPHFCLNRLVKAIRVRVRKSPKDTSIARYLGSSFSEADNIHSATSPFLLQRHVSL
jgi:hypothetical protein